ncbi:calcium/proton exchanger [Crocosphaera sp. UHCC 0190]|uniref:calcium/proton exchanger n=1 Tax=Crocosphaera sp. UHCC 0190 TaxID=3110246 RepID=UPI002B1EA874|nr:calcium/proton exchanger [Crocosphaera sp. UHCC 0190]MEA5510270.1 calcium/proton exchanger [Crocosphaera sp. UHCC 0190]
MTFEKSVALFLLILVPLSIAADVLNWDKSFSFIYSVLSIIPLSIGLSIATEKVAIFTGPTLGGLVNAIFGSATTLIIAFVALKEGLVDLVKASITGSILSDLLLFLGLAMLTGGIRYKEQEFQPILARVNGLSMTLGVIAIALPTLAINTSNLVDPKAIEQISVMVATVLIIVYGLTLLFSLKTHSYLYDVSVAIETESDSLEGQKLTGVYHQLWLWIIVLLLMTMGVAFESELFVKDLDSVIDGFGFTPLFTGVILLPLISDVAGIVTVVRLALKNQMDLTVATATGDSLLITLLVAPLLILVGGRMNPGMDLDFNFFEVVAMAVAVTVTNLISFSGRSNWLDGTLLLATYFILGVSFFYHPV